MKPSQLLLQFLRAWLSWAEDNAPSDNEIGFKRGCGLCWNSREYIRYLGMTLGRNDVNAIHHVHDDALERELRSHFKRACLDPDYPFDNGSCFRYEDASYTDAHHVNPRRLQWVRDMLEDRL